MRKDRGPLPAMVLALCFHGPFVAAGFYRFSWDASTHMFFADHYRRSWFALWEPRWFGGFSVSSYPPLVHQLLALLLLLTNDVGARWWSSLARTWWHPFGLLMRS